MTVVDFLSDVRLSHITVSTAMPHGAVRPELQVARRIGPSRPHLFQKLCLQDPQNVPFCRELYYLAIKLGRKNTTGRSGGNHFVDWPEGLQKQPAKQNFIENVEDYVVGEAANVTMMASSYKPISEPILQSGFGNKYMLEPLQATGTER